MKLIRASIVVALSLAYFSYVFRLPDPGVLTAGLGDWVDPYFINYLLEHWRHSFWTLSDPASPPMYFPTRATLGYSHGLILYAPFYLVVRSVLNPFQAYNATLFLVLVAGSHSLYLVARRGLGLGFVESVLLSAFFCTSRNVINGGAGHWSQRASVFLIPPILLLAVCSARMREGPVRLFLGALVGLAGMLLFTQDFYTAQLAVLVTALLGVGLILISRARLQRAAREVWRAAAVSVEPRHWFSRRPSVWWLVAACGLLMWSTAVVLHPIVRRTIGALPISATDPTRPLAIGLLSGSFFAFRFVGALRRSPVAITSPLLNDAILLWRRERPYLLAFALGSFAGLVVFLWIYAGVYREHRQFPADQLINSLVPVKAGLDLRPSLEAALGAYDSLRPFKLVAFVAMLVWLPWLHVDRATRLLCLWVLVVGVVVLAIPLRLGDFSIWKSLFAPFPGFSVIRDPKRIAPLFDLAVVLLAGMFLKQSARRSLLRHGTALLVFLLIITEWNVEGFGFGRRDADYVRWVGAPIRIDESCKSFFIGSASDEYMARSFHMWSLYNVDAMFVSLNHSIPTLNGYSAWTPDHWDLANPQERGYLSKVDSWIERQKLTGVCEFDVDARTMRPYATSLVNRLGPEVQQKR